jgi:hypothetical protein
VYVTKQSINRATSQTPSYNSLTGRGHGLLQAALAAEEGTLDLVGGRVLLLEDLEGLGNLGLNGGLVPPLDLGRELG